MADKHQQRKETAALKCCANSPVSPRGSDFRDDQGLLFQYHLNAEFMNRNNENIRAK